MQNRFIFVFFSFYPENIPYSHIIKEIASYLVENNHPVEIITYQQSNKDIEKIKKNKILSKIKITYIKKYFSYKPFSYIWFSIASFYYALYRKECTIVTTSTPPIIMPFSISFAKLISGKKFKFVYHCQDIHPESMSLSFKREYKIRRKLLSIFENFSLRNADMIITLSEEMKRSILKKNADVKIKVINNFVPNRKVQLTLNRPKANDIRIIYAGNIGKFQCLENFVDIILNEDIGNIKLTLMGNGERKGSIVKKIEEHSNCDRINIIDPVNNDEVVELLSQFDFGLVSLCPKVLNYANPSKLVTYLAAKIPVFVLADENTTLENIVHINEIGIFAYSNNREDIIRKLHEIFFVEFDESKIEKSYSLLNSKEKLLLSFYNGLNEL